MKKVLIGHCFLKLFLKIPIIYDMHSSLVEQLDNFNFFGKNLVKKVFLLFESLTINKADVLIVICPYLFELVKKNKPTKKVFLIENIPITNFVTDTKKSVGEFKETLNLTDEKVVLYTGTFGYNQGLSMLFQSIPIVLKHFTNTKFILVGGEKKEIDELKKEVLRLGLEKAVIFAGKRSPNEIPLFVQVADVIVSPRIRGTNIPLKIYTYLASGKPIVATNLLVHTQILNENVAKLVEANAMAFAEGIISVLNNETESKRIGANAKKLIDEKYNRDIYILKIKEVYNYIEELGGYS